MKNKTKLVLCIAVAALVMGGTFPCSDGFFKVTAVAASEVTENPCDKQDNKEVLYDGSYWEQPAKWGAEKIDPDKYTGSAKIWIDKVEVAPDDISKEVKVNFNVSGAAGKVSGLAFHTYNDPRLETVAVNGKLIEKGDAITDFSTILTTIKDGENNYVASASDNKLADGVMFSMTFKLPSDAKPGDLYPIGIQFHHDTNTSDYFYDSAQTLYGRQQMAYIFTKGITNGYISVSDDGEPTGEASGKCGDELRWEFKDNKLTLAGSGDMYDYGASTVPWRKYAVDVIDLPYGMTSLGDYALYNTELLKTIDIPDSVKRIGNYTFEATSLEEIELPAELTEIGIASFSRTKNLKNIVIPKGVTKIPEYAFAFSGLEEIVVPATVTEIEKNAFLYCSSLTDFFVMDPDCTLPKNDLITNTSKAVEVGSEGKKTFYTGTIHGYEDSTAQKYAEDNNIAFKAFSLGDPNIDSKIDSNDASYILGVYSVLSTGGEATLTHEQEAAADVNFDGRIDSNDASAVLAYYSYTSTGGKEKIVKFLRS